MTGPKAKLFTIQKPFITITIKPIKLSFFIGAKHQLCRRDTLAKRTDLPQPVNDIPDQTPDDRRKIMHRVSLKLERYVVPSQIIISAFVYMRRYPLSIFV